MTLKSFSDHDRADSSGRYSEDFRIHTGEYSFIRHTFGADSHNIVLTLYKKKLPSGVINTLDKYETVHTTAVFER